MDVFDLRTYLVLALECQVCVVNAILWHFPVIDMYAILFTTICHLKHALRTWIDCSNPDEESTWRYGVKKLHWTTGERRRVCLGKTLLVLLNSRLYDVLKASYCDKPMASLRCACSLVPFRNNFALPLITSSRISISVDSALRINSLFQAMSRRCICRERSLLCSDIFSWANAPIKRS